MSEPATPSPYSKDNPFFARLVENRRLNGPGSAKDTRHLVVDIAGSGLAYEAGDSLGVYPTNDARAVDEVLRLLGASGDEPVQLPREAAPVLLREALMARLSLAGPTRKAVQFFAEKATDVAEHKRLAALLAAGATDQLAAYLAEREFVDLLAEYPSARPTPQEFVDQLRRLMPRLYSIASSPRRQPERIDLLVAVVRYTTNNRQRLGVCSTFLADRAELGRTPVPVFLTSSHFRLPEDPAADVIMVGPGTGLAPFRAFLQEREALGATGRNWLFFGDQRRATDFLYEEELSGWQARGVLHRLDTAFSRDQAGKVYVQDRMRENAAELWAWMQRGASLYVCGDARRMAKDVDQTLHLIIAEQGGLDPVATTEYVKALKREKRYQRDVY
jgi:sulfite reductase (NADPH) flavoprotein alpha-component